MECDRCGASMEAAECREPGGKKLWENCSLDAANPLQACDRKEPGTISSPEAANLWGVSEEDVRREFATMRHLVLLRGHKQRQQVLIALF